MKRFLPLLLVLTLLLPLAACGKEETAPAVTTVPAATESAAPETTGDNLPDKDFNGREYRILTYDMCIDDFVAEEMTGALINDALYDRNLEVSERFGVVLRTDGESAYTEAASKLRNSVSSGDDAYDLISLHEISTAPLAVQHHYRDWNDFTYVDPMQDWWNRSSYEDLSVAGHSFLLAGDISPYFLTHYYCVYMNKRLGTDYGLTDTIYDTALSGKFTIDYYIKKVIDTWTDLDGDGQKSEKDFYGLAAQVSSYATPFYYAFGEKAVKQDKNGLPVLDMNEEKTVNIVEKVYKLLYETNGTITTTGWSLHTTTFREGRALFFNGVFAHAISIINDMEDDFAILPYPKWTEEQEGYYTMSDGSSPLVSVPVTATDTEFIGIITEALAAGAHKTITPAVIDTALKFRGARDETSVKVIELILPGGIIDFGFVFSNNNSMGALLSYLMSRKDPNFASWYASNKDVWKTNLDNIVKEFTEGEK